MEAAKLDSDGWSREGCSWFPQWLGRAAGRGKGDLARDRGRGSHSRLALGGPPELGATRFCPPASASLRPPGPVSSVPSLLWGHEWAPGRTQLGKAGH